MRAHITEQTRDRYRGGGVIPAVIPRLLTNSKYSRAPTKTAAAKATVKTHPPASTIPPKEIPMPSPKTILFFNWLAFCWRSETESSITGKLLPLSTSYNIIISIIPFYYQQSKLKHKLSYFIKTTIPNYQIICNILNLMIIMKSCHVPLSTRAQYRTKIKQYAPHYCLKKKII